MGCLRIWLLSLWLCVLVGPMLACAGDTPDAGKSNSAPRATSDAESGKSRPIPKTGADRKELVPLDDLMVEFLREFGLPGAALAVARNGKLVYARGFGYQDLKTKSPVQPKSLFRIASISKPITAVAIFRLVDQGKLSLDDKIFDILEVEPPTGATVDPRLSQITVRHCLNHSGGWDRGQSFDAMFRSVRFAEQLGVEPPAGPETVIRAMMGVPLDFDPGTRYAYSNFGYCLLGRVIEAKTGKGYEDFVRTEILRPMGIRRMRIGATVAAKRLPGEVMYYGRPLDLVPSIMPENRGQLVTRPYGAWYLEAMDSHGGWVASAPDLVRFACECTSPMCLSSESAECMFERPDFDGLGKDGKPKPSYYGCGWNVRPAGKSCNVWHGGSLDGTSTLLVRRHDGMVWAVLFNCRDVTTQTKNVPSSAIDSRVHQAVAQVQEWPDIDLFPRMLRGR